MKGGQLVVVVHTCNISTLYSEAGESWVRGQPGLNNDTLSQKKKKKKQENGNVFFIFEWY
jgi:hypothetical protein